LLLETTTTNGQQNNTFLDSSTNNFTLTRSGTPTQGSVTPYWPDGYWSNYFNGTSSYLTTPDTAALQLGTGDFTIEAWVYVTGGTTDLFIISATGSGGLFFGYNNSTTSWGWGRTAITWDYTTTGATKALNTWQHIAIARSGTAMKLYINGTPIGAGLTTSQSYSLSTTSCAIGSQGAIYYFPGNISNLRVIKGQALITGSGGFTVPTAPLTLGAVGWSGTNVASSISGTVSLLTCQSNRFKDNSTSPLTLTLNGTPATQAFQPFPPVASYTTAAYGGSTYLNGSTDYLSAGTSTTAFAFGASVDFTVECWVYLTAYSSGGTLGGGLVGTTGGANTGWFINSGQDINTLRITSNASGSWADNITVAAGNGLPLNQWAHIAFVRSGGNLTLYKNGVSVASMTGASAYNFTSPNNLAYIGYTLDGGGSPRYVPGYISNARIVKGTAVYTSAFTPPTAPVTAITNTSLLTNFTNAGIYDAAVQNNQLTAGSAQASTTVYKWSPTSMKFNGTTDYLYIPTSPSFGFGAQDFTIEFWFYPTNVAAAGAQNIIDVRSGNSAIPITMGINGGFPYAYNGSFQTSSIGVSNNVWYYLALVRSGSGTNNCKLYVNGSLGVQFTDASNFGSSNACGIARNQFLSLEYFYGYVQDLRITKGIARTITTPTAAFPTR
jgi:hypothetical protein